MFLNTQEPDHHGSCKPLTLHFGKFGQRLFELCRGIDDRPVRVNRQRKSLGVERTFSGDLPDLHSLSQRLPELLQELERRWSKAAAQYRFKGLVLKLKFHDFTLTTASCTAAYEWDREALQRDFQELLNKAWHRGQKPARLLGLGLQTCARDHTEQVQAQLPML